MSFFEVDVEVLVTLTNSDWSGEQVNVQKRLKKFVLQAGHVEIKGSAFLRFELKASTCSSVSADRYSNR